MRILVIGLSRDLPLGPADAMELADHLVKRAAAVQADGRIGVYMNGTVAFTYTLYNGVLVYLPTPYLCLNNKLNFDLQDDLQILSSVSNLISTFLRRMPLYHSG